MVLQLEQVVVGAQDLHMLPGDRVGCAHVAAQDGLGQLAADAGAQTDQALAVLGEQLLVDPRLVVVPLELRAAHQRDEIAVAGGVTCEQNEVVGIAVGSTLLVVP